MSRHVALILAALMLSACAAAKTLFLPGPCHPDEIIQSPHGSLVIAQNPCRVPRNP